MAISGSNFTDLYHQLLGRPEWDAPWRYVDTPGIEQAADGLVAFNANTAQMFESFLLLVGRPELIGDRTYSGLKSRLALEDKWQEIIDAFVREQPVGELIELATELRIPAAPVHDGQSIIDDEHLASRGIFADRGDGVLEPRPPYRIDGAAVVTTRVVAAVCPYRWRGPGSSTSPRGGWVQPRRRPWPTWEPTSSTSSPPAIPTA
jgi:crotonobetainyl-CoA:carnitine CoA-transferase CaiB-like acyl-CoA transferase